MPSNRPPHCPLCGFGFAWDGGVCGHCRFPKDARRRWAAVDRVVTLWEGTPVITRRAALLFAAACFARSEARFPPHKANKVVRWLQNRAGNDYDRLSAADHDRDPLDVARSAPPAVPDDAVTDPDAYLAASLGLAEAAGRPGPGRAGAVPDAARCLRLAARWQDFPPKRTLDFPLPPECEPHRAAIATLTARERDDLQRRGPGDPLRKAYRTLTVGSHEYAAARNAATRAEEAAQCDLFRDVVAYPFEPVRFDPGWRTEAAVALARGMSDARDFTDMPVLADALDDAGCTDDHVIGHCRDPDRPHVRGCWVVEHLLGEQGA